MLRQYCQYFVRGEAIGVEPHRPRRGLAHLGPARGGQQRGGQTVEIEAGGPAPELDPAYDVPPLIRSAHLQAASVTAPELQEVVRLEDHVVELEEGERLLAVEPELHRFEAEHPVDREVPAVLPQERDVAEGVEPLRIVGHQGRAVPVVPAEVEEALEDAPDPRDVGGDALVGEQLPALVLARRIADSGGAAPHQDDGAMSGTLHVPQQHDGNEAPGVQ